MTGSRPTQDYEFPGRDDDVVRVRGHLLGFASSERDAHSHADVHVDDEEVAQTLAWVARRHVELTQRHAERVLSATELGHARSALDAYEALLSSDEPPEDKPLFQTEPGRCSRCRWFEARIIRVDAELGDDPRDDEPPRGRYLVLTYGRTRVPGETDRRRAARSEERRVGEEGRCGWGEWRCEECVYV